MASDLGDDQERAAGINQGVHTLPVPLTEGDEEGGLTVAVGQVRVRPPLEQKRDAAVFLRDQK